MLVIDGGDGRFGRTPVLPAEKSRVARTLTLTLSAGGPTRVVEDAVVEGQGAPEWRRYYQAPGERRDRYEKQWNAWFAGAKLDRVDMPTLAAIAQPVRVHAEGTAPEVGRAGAGGGRTLPATGRPSELAQAWARTSRRKHDLVIDYPWVQEERVVWELPAGFAARVLPRQARVESPFGELDLVASPDGERKLVVTWRLELATRRGPAADYAKFREFLVAVDAALNQTIEVSR